MPPSLRDKIRQFFIRSSVIHQRGDPIESAKDFVDLVDRLVDGNVRYDMEWDDFFSWENANPQLEEIRNRLGEFEPLLVSDDPKKRDEYWSHLVTERNRLAAILGLPQRSRIESP